MVLWTTTLPHFEEILVYSFGPRVEIYTKKIPNQKKYEYTHMKYTNDTSFTINITIWPFLQVYHTKYMNIYIYINIYAYI